MKSLRYLKFSGFERLGLIIILSGNDEWETHHIPQGTQ